jgi:hypothetical protein
MMPSKQLMRRNTDFQGKTKSSIDRWKTKKFAKVQRTQSKQLMRSTNLPSKKEAALTD